MRKEIEGVLTDREFISRSRVKVITILHGLEHDEFLSDPEIRELCGNVGCFFSQAVIRNRIVPGRCPEPFRLGLEFNGRNILFSLCFRPDFLVWVEGNPNLAKGLVLQKAVAFNMCQESSCLVEPSFVTFVQGRSQFWRGFYLAQLIEGRKLEQKWLDRDSERALLFYRENYSFIAQEY